MSHQELSITCADDFKLSATIYQPEVVKGAVMIAPATGIRKVFYHSFATHLATSGYGVICFENRGIGKSINGSLNDGNPSLITWGHQDMTAVLEQLKHSFPDTSYHLIGHSAGGQLVGLMENCRDLTSMVNYASSSGCIRNMTYPFKASAIFYLNIFIPVSNLLFGKTHSQWVGMGEPLPKRVASQWSRWCNGAGYVATDFGKAVQDHRYDDLTFPSLWIHATDDPIANLANVKDMMRVYSASDKELVTLDPGAIDHKQIGHMGFFSSKKRDLWTHALDWLEKHSS